MASRSTPQRWFSDQPHDVFTASPKSIISSLERALNAGTNTTTSPRASFLENLQIIDRKVRSSNQIKRKYREAASSTLRVYSRMMIARHVGASLCVVDGFNFDSSEQLELAGKAFIRESLQQSWNLLQVFAKLPPAFKELPAVTVMYMIGWIVVNLLDGGPTHWLVDHIESSEFPLVDKLIKDCWSRVEKSVREVFGACSSFTETLHLSQQFVAACEDVFPVSLGLGEAVAPYKPLPHGVSPVTLDEVKLGWDEDLGDLEKAGVPQNGAAIYSRHNPDWIKQVTRLTKENPGYPMKSIFRSYLDCALVKISVQASSDHEKPLAYRGYEEDGVTRIRCVPFQSAVYEALMTLLPQAKALVDRMSPSDTISHNLSSVMGSLLTGIWNIAFIVGRSNSEEDRFACREAHERIWRDKSFVWINPIRQRRHHAMNTRASTSTLRKMRKTIRKSS